MESLLAAAIVLMVALSGTLLLRQRASLARSQAMLTATLDNIAQGIVMQDPAGRVVVMNRQAEELFARGANRPRLGTILDLPQPGAGLDPTTEDGRTLEIRTTKLADGSTVRTYADVTAIRENTAALATARDAAEAAGRARADFLAVMSHEIRTPLNGIIGVAGLLLDGSAGPPLDTQPRHYVNVILQSGEHLLQLINDILDFSRLDAKRLELEETAFDVRSVIRSAVELLASESKRKGIEVTLAFADDVPVRAGGDPGRLRQVLLNLVGNAVKFTDTGSVRVSVSRVQAAPQAEPGAAPADRRSGGVRLAVAVTDTGIGISPDGLERLFGEFVQGDSSISRRFGGSGLGLAISRRLIEQMGGTITVESRLGFGSTFRFDIPLRARRASDSGTAAAPVRELQPVPLGPPLHVLVAEDNPTNALVVTRLLERQGHRVTAVADGAAAVAACAAVAVRADGAFDLVLMDVMMPILDGISATQQIRALPAPACLVPIIGLTANAMPSEEQECRQAGMGGFATKPITAARLAEVIAQAVSSQAVSAQAGSSQAGSSRALSSQAWSSLAVSPQAMSHAGPDEASDTSEAVPPAAMPVAFENRSFDPAVLDMLVTGQGSEAAAVAAADFIATAPEALALLRTLAGIGDTKALLHKTRRLAGHAANFGLMRAARAGFDLTGEPGELAGFSGLLLQGLEELKAWHRSLRP